jgi:antitoxin component HigA of HigAB toxin-antitoxin module
MEGSAMSTLARRQSNEVSDDCLHLIRAFPLRSLRSEADHSAAVKILARLLGRPNRRLSQGERDYADVLGRLIDDYGEKEFPHLPPKHSPLELLRFLMTETGMNTQALGKVWGTRPPHLLC